MTKEKPTDRLVADTWASEIPMLGSSLLAKTYRKTHTHTAATPSQHMQQARLALEYVFMPEA